MARTLTGGLIRATPLVHTGAPTITLPFTATRTVPNALGTRAGDFAWVDFIGDHQWQIASGQARLVTSSGVAQGGYLNRDAGTDDVAAVLTYPNYTPGTNTLSA